MAGNRAFIGSCICGRYGVLKCLLLPFNLVGVGGSFFITCDRSENRQVKRAYSASIKGSPIDNVNLHYHDGTIVLNEEAEF